jgi:4-alpha-glucanotransferase
MDGLKERAARWGIETEYWDGLGRHRAVEAETLSRLLDTLTKAGQPAWPAASPAGSAHAYQGKEGTQKKLWALAVQLYGLKSRRNWGHAISPISPA